MNFCNGEFVLLVCQQFFGRKGQGYVCVSMRFSGLVGGFGKCKWDMKLGMAKLFAH